MSEEQATARIVDGYNSYQTYVVLAIHGEDRVSLRFLGYTGCPEMDDEGNPLYDGLLTIAASWKVHIEKDDLARSDIQKRSIVKFGLPDKFCDKGNRHTATLVTPFAYRVNNGAKLVQCLQDANLAEVLWEAVVKPCIDNGATPVVDKEVFNAWVESQTEHDPLYTYAVENDHTRGAPIVKAWWNTPPKTHVDNDD